MKKLLIGVLLLSSLSVSAQHKNPIHLNKSGNGLIIAGCISMSIGFLIPDGSEWTYSSGGLTGTIVRRPFYTNTSRMSCIGVGLTISIGGLIYNKNNK